MLGVRSYEECVVFLDRLGDIKAMLHSEDINHELCCRTLIYVYDDEVTRQKHVTRMKEDGWIIVEDQTYVTLYRQCGKQDLKALCGVYRKAILNS